MPKQLTLDALLRLAGEHAERVLIGLNHDALIPSYMLLDDDGRSQIIACPWRDDDDKALLVAEVKKMAATHKATSLSFVSEVWMTDSREASDVLMVRPAEHPKRREFVLAIAADKAETKLRRWQIIRNRIGGKIIALVDDPTVEGGQFSGRLVEGILP